MLFFSSLRRNLAHPAILVVLALILVPTLFLPLGIDQSIFVRGGEVLFGKGKLYIDYLEIKPPLLFLFYGIGGTLFGNSDISYRFFDFLWQLLTIYSLLYCVQRLTQRKVTGIISAAVYAVLYSSM
ncbi:MAG: glycosyltransferase family 39 protein, partial [Ignavibacteriae bacterium]|nr:glycosyltransferase family 39 protein [Ignavibacteriota bacterium]